MSDRRTEPIGDFRLSTFRRIEKYDSTLDWIIQFWRVNKKALLAYSTVALISFGIGYTAFAGMGWYHTFLVFVYLAALSGISFILGAVVVFTAIMTAKTIKGVK